MKKVLVWIDYPKLLAEQAAEIKSLEEKRNRLAGGTTALIDADSAQASSVNSGANEITAKQDETKQTAPSNQANAKTTKKFVFIDNAAIAAKNDNRIEELKNEILQLEASLIAKQVPTVTVESVNFLYSIFRKRKMTPASRIYNPGRVLKEQKEKLRDLENITAQLLISPEISMRVMALVCLNDGEINKAEDFFQSALELDRKIFSDLGIEKTDDYTPNIQVLIKALRTLNVSINPTLPYVIILYIASLSDNKAFLNTALSCRSMSALVALEIKHRFFFFVRAGGIEEVRQALQKMDKATQIKMLSSSLASGWEDKDGFVCEWSDTPLQLAWRAQDYPMYDLIKSALDNVLPNASTAQMKAFQGQQSDCLAEIENIYPQLIRNFQLPHVDDESVCKFDRLAYAFLRCWKNNAYVIHRLCNDHSGWNEKNVTKLFTRDLKQLQIVIKAALGSYENAIKFEVELGRLALKGKGFLLCRNDAQVEHVKHALVAVTRNDTKVQTIRFVSLNTHDQECFARLAKDLNESRALRAQIFMDEEKALSSEQLSNYL